MGGQPSGWPLEDKKANAFYHFSAHNGSKVSKIRHRKAKA